MNFYTDLFDQCKVEKISSAVEKFVSKFIFPSWRYKIEIRFFVPQSQESLIAQGAIVAGSTGYINPIEQSGTYIPIYLINEFSDNINNNFATAVHGAVSGSVINGPSALYYISGDDTLGSFGPLPYGTPFIVIPSGSTGPDGTGNGITAAVASNIITGLGPIDYYQVLSQTICHHVLEVLINPTGARYVSAGNPQGLDAPPGPTEQIFYFREPVDPFSQGKDNLIDFRGWTMTNCALPAYFFPFNNSGVYDILGNSQGPFLPYKGTQFVIYQEQVDGVISELQVGNYISSPNDPFNIQFVSNGSIYDYSGWGLTFVKPDAPTLKEAPKVIEVLKSATLDASQEAVAPAKAPAKVAAKSPQKLPQKSPQKLPQKSPHPRPALSRQNLRRRLRSKRLLKL